MPPSPTEYFLLSKPIHAIRPNARYIDPSSLRRVRALGADLAGVARPNQLSALWRLPEQRLTGCRQKPRDPDSAAHDSRPRVTVGSSEILVAPTPVTRRARQQDHAT